MFGALSAEDRVMAARSISVTIVNNTNKRLIRSASAADSGVYTVEPPSVIAVGAQGQFNMESVRPPTGWRASPAKS